MRGLFPQFANQESAFALNRQLHVCDLYRIHANKTTYALVDATPVARITAGAFIIGKAEYPSEE
jgi:hypothetical protein